MRKRDQQNSRKRCRWMGSRQAMRLRQASELQANWQVWLREVVKPGHRNRLIKLRQFRTITLKMARRWKMPCLKRAGRQMQRQMLIQAAP